MDCPKCPIEMDYIPDEIDIYRCSLCDREGKLGEICLLEKAPQANPEEGPTITCQHGRVVNPKTFRLWLGLDGNLPKRMLDLAKKKATKKKKT